MKNRITPLTKILYQHSVYYLKMWKKVLKFPMFILLALKLGQYLQKNQAPLVMVVWVQNIP